MSEYCTPGLFKPEKFRNQAGVHKVEGKHKARNLKH